MADDTTEETQEVTAVTPAPKAPVDVPLSDETAYKVPAPTVQEHDYQYAAIIELRRLRASVNRLVDALLQNTAGAPSQEDTGEVSLKEPAKTKPRHRDEAQRQAEAAPLSMVEPVPQDDPVSLVEVDPDEGASESKSKAKKE